MGNARAESGPSVRPCTQSHNTSLNSFPGIILLPENQLSAITSFAVNFFGWLPLKGRDANNGRDFTQKFCDAYRAYFGQDVVKEEWTPTKCCQSCYSVLLNWYSGKQAYLAFKVPAKWSMPSHQIDPAIGKVGRFLL